MIRKLLVSALLLAITQVSFAQESTEKELLKFRETEHDFSSIPQGKPVYYQFELVNTGDKPMKIDEVHTTCGCTTPEFSREPIAPGATTQLKVGYNAAAEGYFEKYITVT